MTAFAACCGVAKVLMFGAAAVSAVSVRQIQNVANNETRVFMVVLLISVCRRHRRRVNVRRRRRASVRHRR
jgi:hypothetical protein